MNTTTPKQSPYEALKLPEFRLFIAARFLLTCSIQIQSVLVGWQIYSITKNPVDLGLIGLCEAIPGIAVALYAGHLADIYSRKRIIQCSVLLLVVCFIGLATYSYNITKHAILPSVVPIYGLVFFTGIARGFVGPSLFAMMPQIVTRKELYSNAITWNSSTWQTASVVGPAIAGFLFASLGFVKSYGVIFSMGIASFVLFSLLKTKPLFSNEIKETIAQRLTDGIRFVYHQKAILGAMILDLFAVLFGGAVALLPIFASDILEAGVTGLGLLRAAPAFGAVLMAVVLAYLPVRKKAGFKMMSCVAGFGVCMIVFAFSKSFWISFAVLIISGMFDSVSVIVRSTLIHSHTPEHMKGRVSAINNIFIGSSNEIGAFESGLMARWMGVVPSVIFGGCMTWGVVMITYFKGDKLRKVDL